MRVVGRIGRKSSGELSLGDFGAVRALNSLRCFDIGVGKLRSRTGVRESGEKEGRQRMRRRRVVRGQRSVDPF